MHFSGRDIFWSFKSQTPGNSRSLFESSALWLRREATRSCRRQAIACYWQYRMSYFKLCLLQLKHKINYKSVSNVGGINCVSRKILQSSSANFVCDRNNQLLHLRIQPVININNLYNVSNFSAFRTNDRVRFISAEFWHTHTHIRSLIIFGWHGCRE